MTILFDNETTVDKDMDYEGIAGEAVVAALDFVNCPYECEINILLTDNEGIQKVNSQMRGMDVPTDVLSFPALEFEQPGDFSIAEQDIPVNFNAESGELLLGDILVSLEQAVKQAEEFNHSLKREFAFLIVHSILHLSGYDHMDEKERIQMEEMQEAILRGMGYTRDMKE